MSYGGDDSGIGVKPPELGPPALEEVLVDDSARWHRERIRVYRYTGNIRNIAFLVPTFERWPFAVADFRTTSERPSPGNKYFDVIVRRPFQDSAPVPVGIVSKKYVLVQHTQIVDALANACARLTNVPDTLPWELTITEYGSRMALRVIFPPRYEFDPGDGHPLALRLECVNSVDGSTRFQIHFGWFRFVCSNGLVLGKALSMIDSFHAGGLDLSSTFEVIQAGLRRVDEDVALLRKWVRIPVPTSSLIDWVDGPVRRKWGVFTAARAYNIAMTGRDGKIKGSPQNAAPHEISICEDRPVPGAMAPARDAFAISQVLAWLARDRSDLHEQIVRVQDIPTLMEALVG